MIILVDFNWLLFMDEKDKLFFKYGKDRYFFVILVYFFIYCVIKNKFYIVISCGDILLENV